MSIFLHKDKYLLSWFFFSLLLWNLIIFKLFRRREIKLNLELSRVPQESNSSSPTSVPNKLLSSPILPVATTGTTPTSSTSTTTTTTTSPVPGNQIRRCVIVIYIIIFYIFHINDLLIIKMNYLKCNCKFKTNFRSLLVRVLELNILNHLHRHKICNCNVLIMKTRLQQHSNNGG